MSVDNRSVHTDALATLGSIIDDSAGRDAIHLAVEPIIAGEILQPGEHIRIVNGKAFAGGDTFGIVDPFLKRAVQTGERFWFVIYPRQITSLRHVWEHPKFAPMEGHAPTPEELEIADKTRRKLFRNQSKEWLRNFCETHGDAPSFEALMEKLETGEIGSDWDSSAMHFNGNDAHGYIPEEFWEHVENVIDRKLGEDERPEYFSCSC